MSPRLIALLLLTQVLAAAARGDLILCLHGDGHVAVESSARVCCREDTACSESCGDDGCAAETVRTTTSISVGAGGSTTGCCRDFTLVKCGPMSFTFPSVRPNESTSGGDPSPLAAPIALFENGESPAKGMQAARFSSASPSHTLARLKTTFLRL